MLRDLVRQLIRFTPTPVGTTAIMRAWHASLVGSPPRLWGRRSGDGLRHFATLRFTPTPVGTTSARPSRGMSALPVHPHACGDESSVSIAVGLSGSVHPHACGDDAGVRGTTGKPISGSPPRLWGRPLGAQQQPPYGIGSPPRLWGRRQPLRDRDFPKRFTPTPVGTTWTTQ